MACMGGKIRSAGRATSGLGGRCKRMDKPHADWVDAYAVDEDRASTKAQIDYIPWCCTSPSRYVHRWLRGCCLAGIRGRLYNRIGRIAFGNPSGLGGKPGGCAVRR